MFQTFCIACDQKQHKKKKFVHHERDTIVVGKPWERETILEGDELTFPEVHDWVTVKYKCLNEKTGEVLDESKVHHQPMKYQAGCSGPCIHLQVLGADNIHAADLMGFSDPYVAVFWNDKLVGKTKVRIMTLNPRWALESFVLPLSKEFVDTYRTGHKHIHHSDQASLPTLKASDNRWSCTPSAHIGTDIFARAESHLTRSFRITRSRSSTTIW